MLASLPPDAHSRAPMSDLADPDVRPASTIYRVLARKYRPSTFAGLIGQSALVRTLSNAIATGRLAHAFVLTGVRGVGKTTTARIIARALNCIGPDGTGGPTIAPCGTCQHCVAIAQDRHLDVIEMDAASRTGIDDIRTIIDGVQYAPVSARYKIYIIDEVHMLSKAAFNGLLKTLEEPPPHVKFVFATTEIRKVPVTVLSRCQRFDLRRVPAELLGEHFAAVAGQEGATLDPEALALIARAADGSVRDGLSLLDQAIAHSGDRSAISAAAIRAMLGLADRTAVFDLFEALLRGESPAALGLFGEMYDAGADPIAVVQDLLELTHWLTRLKITPADADAPHIPEAERVRGREIAEKLSMAALTRTWQMLLKGLAEAQQAPAPRLAVDMLFVRLTYAASLPSPIELVRQIESGDAPAPQARSTQPEPNAGAWKAATPPGPAKAIAPDNVPAAPPPVATASAAPALAIAQEPEAAADPEPEVVSSEPAHLATFEQLVALFREHGELLLHAQLWNNVHLVSLRPGRLEYRPNEHAAANLAGEVAGKLSRWTNQRWVVTVVREEGEPTLAAQAAQREAQLRREVTEHPLVKAALATFPGAVIEGIRTIERLAAPELPPEAPFTDHGPLDEDGADYERFLAEGPDLDSDILDDEEELE